MFQNFYTTQMSDNAKSLQKRFAKIRSGSSKTARFMALIMTVAVLVATACATIVMASIDGVDGISEYHGAMFTYYDYPQESIEYNVRNVLNIGNEKHSEALLYPMYSSVRYGYNTFERYFTPLCISNLTSYYLIDEQGKLIDMYNRREPYYAVIKYWLPKDKILSVSWEDIEKTEIKTMNIDGKEVTVCFADDAIFYKDDKTLEKMIKNQITFEFNYKNEYFDYDHNAYISEIIERGVYVVKNVFLKEAIQSHSYFGGHYGDFTEEAIIKDNINNKALQASRIQTFYNDKTPIPKNIDGNQGQKLNCEVKVNKNECVIIDVKNTTDKMPYINYKMIAKNGLSTYSQLLLNGKDVQPGETVEVFMMNGGSTRRNYLPFSFSFSDSITYEIVVSGPESDYADIEIYTCKASDDATEDYQNFWEERFCYKDSRWWIKDE